MPNKVPSLVTPALIVVMALNLFISCKIIKCLNPHDGNGKEDKSHRIIVDIYIEGKQNPLNQCFGLVTYNLKDK